MELVKSRVGGVLKKYRYTLLVLVLCSRSHFYYNMVCSQNNYIQNKYKTTGLQFHYLKPDLNNTTSYYDDLGLYCEPSYMFIKNTTRVLYNGISALRVEELINRFT